jgi:hypothetical protein
VTLVLSRSVPANGYRLDMTKLPKLPDYPINGTKADVYEWLCEFGRVQAIRIPSDTAKPTPQGSTHCIKPGFVPTISATKLKTLRTAFEKANSACFIAEDRYRALKETPGKQRTLARYRAIKARSRMQRTGYVYAKVCGW